MAVVFDEVVGTVEPEAAPVPEQPERLPTPQEPSLDKVRVYLKRLEQRAARLRAD